MKFIANFGALVCLGFFTLTQVVAQAPAAPVEIADPDPRVQVEENFRNALSAFQGASLIPKNGMYDPTLRDLAIRTATQEMANAFYHRNFLDDYYTPQDHARYTVRMADTLIARLRNNSDVRLDSLRILLEIFEKKLASMRSDPEYRRRMFWPSFIWSFSASAGVETGWRSLSLGMRQLKNLGRFAFRKKKKEDEPDPVRVVAEDKPQVFTFKSLCRKALKGLGMGSVRLSKFVGRHVLIGGLASIPAYWFYFDDSEPWTFADEEMKKIIKWLEAEILFREKNERQVSDKNTAPPASPVIPNMNSSGTNQ